jgi:hypothetical protein
MCDSRAYHLEPPAHARISGPEVPWVMSGAKALDLVAAWRIMLLPTRDPVNEPVTEE